MIVRAKLRVQRNARAMTVGVRIDKAKTEHNESAYPPIADMGTDNRIGSDVPLADSCSAAKSSYSITSSARASSMGGTVRSSILAVSALMTSSNLLACTTARSAGFAPLRMRPV
jgi:hypothetical protein